MRRGGLFQSVNAIRMAALGSAEVVTWFTVPRLQAAPNCADRIILTRNALFRLVSNVGH